MYEYKCTVIRVIDGDTVDCSVDLGFEVSVKQRFRLMGINAPETKTPEGKKAKARLQELMPEGAVMFVKTFKDKKEKYGRYLGRFYDDDGHEVNERMVLEGLAVRYME